MQWALITVPSFSTRVQGWCTFFDGLAGLDIGSDEHYRAASESCTEAAQLSNLNTDGAVVPVRQLETLKLFFRVETRTLYEVHVDVSDVHRRQPPRVGHKHVLTERWIEWVRQLFPVESQLLTVPLSGRDVQRSIVLAAHCLTFTRIKLRPSDFLPTSYFHNKLSRCPRRR